ncbi:glutaredoxin [Pisolithus orientalis]|uniref:glutaredoxin n=1 Tax=Pisolithus orientalis TaxID=936130 RepID=UPI0022255CA4|nr:glutaredoxin [Pisolithus orientalis]KAI5995825.1 glutaredoxin [Pisolithus orientalis]
MAPADNNVHEITSTKQFQDLLSADLNRVSLINFWAPWAEPCKQMNNVVMGLAKKYPQVLVLQVQAEEQEDISESFDVVSVPTVLLLRGHTLLNRIVGADASELTNAISRHLSGTSSLPKPSSSPDGEESDEQLVARVKQIMNQSKVVLFMKGSPDAPRCGFSRQAVALLSDQKVEFTHFDILGDEKVRQRLKQLNDWPTYPQIIVNGELVGGLDILKETVETGEFQKMLESTSA